LDPTHIRNTFPFVPFKQVADCFNKKIKKCESALNKYLALWYCNNETAQNTVSALLKQTALTSKWFPSVAKVVRLVLVDSFMVVCGEKPAKDQLAQTGNCICTTNLNLSNVFLSCFIFIL